MNTKSTSTTVVGTLALLSFGVASACDYGQGGDELGLSHAAAVYAYVNGDPVDVCDAFRVCIHLGTDQGAVADSGRNANDPGGNAPSVGAGDYGDMLPDRPAGGQQSDEQAIPILGTNCDGGVSYPFVANDASNVCEIYAGATPPVLARIAATRQAIAQSWADVDNEVAFD